MNVKVTTGGKKKRLFFTLVVLKTQNTEEFLLCLVSVSIPDKTARPTFQYLKIKAQDSGYTRVTTYESHFSFRRGYKTHLV